MSTGLPDILDDNLSVVFCGLNPGLEAAAAGHHFVGRGNRFWRVLHLAGFTPVQVDPEHDVSVLAFGIGLTAVVDRPTAGVDGVADEEFVAGGVGLRRKIQRYRPRNVAFLGKAAYRAITGMRTVPWGRQAAQIAGAIVWVLPNPSGRNLGFSLEALVESYGQLRRAFD
jgi:TDG/mug DNA glycosylase family protein